MSESVFIRQMYFESILDQYQIFSAQPRKFLIVVLFAIAYLSRLLFATDRLFFSLSFQDKSVFFKQDYIISSI